MSRGLSYLQQQILYLVFEKGFVTSSEMLKELWGLQSQKGGSKEPGYASAHATLSRALTRMWWRDLIKLWQDKISHSGTAVTLTDKGRTMAEAILAEETEDEING